SNYISQIQDFIGLLIKNGAAYQRAGEERVKLLQQIRKAIMISYSEKRPQPEKIDPRPGEPEDLVDIPNVPFLLMNCQEKMSKSLGNVISAKQFCQKYGANVLRYLILNAQYNQVINLSEELIRQATKIVVQNTTPLQQEIVANLLNNLNTVK
ncbi:25306_t:CDS:2, partial [Racocetra persica]